MFFSEHSLLAVAVTACIGTASGVVLGVCVTFTAIRHFAKRFGFPL